VANERICAKIFNGRFVNEFFFGLFRNSPQK
jgi:hypothetical protein